MHSLSFRIAVLALVAGPALPLQDAETKDGADGAVTLEDLFPDDGLFGPSARSAAFSHDGRYAAWLYRPYVERRHGNDLWLHDFESGETERVTSVSVLEPFQADTREVALDREEKARSSRSKGNDEDDGEDGSDDADGDSASGSWQELAERARSDDDGDVHVYDRVGEDDADDEDAPRYGGVRSFTWSPNSHELIFSSDGDLYRYVVEGGEIERLTKTRDGERNAQYLPDGSGYTFQAGDALLRVRFGTHFVDQLDPELPSGYSMRDYELSPDGEKVVFLASNSRRSSDDRRTVNIATYRDRFMRVREVPRTVSDDPQPDTTTGIYLYRLPEPQLENGELVKVFEHERSGPRDTLRVPDWAPDSTKVAFSVFEQSSSHVHVLQAEFPPKDEDEDDDGESEDGDEDEADEDADDEGGEEDGRRRGRRGRSRDVDVVEHDARVVYRFLHDGGPTTPRMIDPQFLADSRRIAFLTEQAGFRHVHVLDPVYGTLDQLTSGRYEVYPLDLPRHRECMFVSATKEDTCCLDVYRLDVDTGEMTRLTTRTGRYSSPVVSDDGRHVLATFTAFGSLRELVHVDTESGEEVAFTDSHPEETHELTAAAPELFTFENRHGQEIRGMLFEPEDRDAEDLRPLLVYVYGGPLGTRKQVTQGNFGSDAYFFAWYMAHRHGWVTATIDPRGMSGYGALFEKANFERVGKPQVEDLVDGVAFLVENHGVDPERVALHGWSFGGFQTQMCMYTEPDVFACGIAGAGPTEWENYNAWYSTGTIGPSREGEPDLEKYSLLPLAKNLEGKLLLVHGMEDSNVLYQDTVRVYSELLDAGKETLVELFLDPTGGHGLGGKVKRLNRYRKYEEFLVRNLGSEAAEPKAATAAR